MVSSKTLMWVSNTYNLEVYAPLAQNDTVYAYVSDEVLAPIAIQCKDGTIHINAHHMTNASLYRDEQYVKQLVAATLV